MAYIANDLIPMSAAGPDMILWVYDTTDTAATVAAASYVSDALSRGMNVGDVVWVRQFSSLATKSSLTAFTMHRVTAVATTGSTMGTGVAL